MMDGVLVIDKPSGISSYGVVAAVKRRLGARKVGHGGTLDPMATGVLAVCINEATKISQFLISDTKDYMATALLGVETDTYDIEGKILSRSDRVVSEDEVREGIGRFSGVQLQVPPPFSAVKERGQPLYKFARKGIFIEKPARSIEVFRIEVREIDYPYVTFFVSCSKGTYIRSICAELGQRLGTGGCLAGLRRTRSGAFSEERALKMDDFGNGAWGEAATSRLISLSDALPGLRAMAVGSALEKKLKEGYQPQVADIIENNIPSHAAGDMIKIISSENGALLAVGSFLFGTDELDGIEAKTQAIKIARVFCVEQQKPSHN